MGGGYLGGGVHEDHADDDDDAGVPRLQRADHAERLRQELQLVDAVGAAGLARVGAVVDEVGEGVHEDVQGDGVGDVAVEGDVLPQRHVLGERRLRALVRRALLLPPLLHLDVVEPVQQLRDHRHHDQRAVEVQHLPAAFGDGDPDRAELRRGDGRVRVVADLRRALRHLVVPAPGNFYVNLPPLFLGHFSPIFARFFPVFSPFSPSCRQDSGNRHQDPEKRSVTVEKRRAKPPS